MREDSKIPVPPYAANQGGRLFYLDPSAAEIQYAIDAGQLKERGYPKREAVKLVANLISLPAILLCLAPPAQAQPGGTSVGLAERFNQLDRDGDGKVSLEEGGSLPFFAAADKDKDGFLTFAEAEAHARRSTTANGARTATTRASVAAPEWVTPAVTAPRVQFRTFDSLAAKTRVSYHVYIPAVYAEDPERRFPVLYWLHGTGGGLAGIAPLSAFIDRAIREGKMPPLLVVFPNGLAASMWCDSRDGSIPMETIVVQELLPHIDATFRTVAKREARILEGFSMGGYGAARLGLKYPEIFGAISILAGGPLDLEFRGPRAAANPAERERILQGTFGGDLAHFKAQSPLMIAERSAAAVRGRSRVRQAVGTRDFTAELNRAFSVLLRQLNIEHTFTEVPEVGHDTLALLRGLGEQNWEFYRAALIAVQPP